MTERPSDDFRADQPEAMADPDEEKHLLSKEVLAATSALGMVAIIGAVAAHRLAKKKVQGESE